MAGTDESFDDFVEGYAKKQQDQRTVSDRITAGRPRQPAGAPRVADTDEPSMPSNRPPAVKDSDFEGSTVKLGPWDTGIGMPNAIAKGFAQFGSGIADTPLRIRQLLGTATEADADEKRRIDDPLNRGVAGTLNNLGGKMLLPMLFPQALGARALGAAAPAVTGFATGALQGALEPVATGESAGRNIGMGATFGSIIPGTKLGMQTMTNQFHPILGPLQADAESRGFRFGAADLADRDSMLRSVRNVGKYFPGGRQYLQRMKQNQQDEFTRNVSRAIELNTDHLDEAALQGQKTAIGRRISDIWGRHDLVVTPQLATDLRNARASARTRLTPESSDVVERQVDNFNRKVQRRVNPQTGQTERFIPGNEAHGLQSEWNADYGKFSSNPRPEATHIQNIRRNVNNAFNQQLPADESATLRDAGSKYKAILTLESPVSSAESGIGQRMPGTISPQDLSSAVRQGYPTRVNQSPFGRLPQIGQQFIRDTSTRNRDILANIGIPLAFGSGSGFLANPTLAGVTGGAAGTAGTLGLLVPSMLSSPGLRRVMVNEPTGRLAQTGSRALRAGVVQAPLAWSENTQANEALGPLATEEEDPAIEIPKD